MVHKPSQTIFCEVFVLSEQAMAWLLVLNGSTWLARHYVIWAIKKSVSHVYSLRLTHSSGLL